MNQKKIIKIKDHFFKRIYSITNRIIRRLTLALLVSVFGFTITASAQSGEARHSLGNPAELEGWTGLEKAPSEGPQGGDVARLEVPGTAEFQYPDEGWRESQGFMPSINPAGGWWGWPILAFDVKLPEKTKMAKLTVSLNGGDKNLQRDVEMQTTGVDWQTLYVALEDFRLNEQVTLPWANMKGLSIEASGEDGGESSLLLDNVRLQRGKVVGLMAPVQSKPGRPGETIEYTVSVANSSDRPQAVSLRLEREGSEIIVTTVEPEEIYLAPGEVKEVTVQADIPTTKTPGVSGKLPEGAREHWTLTAVPNGRSDLAERLELIHVIRMEPPYLVHTKEGWDEIRELAETEEWAREKAQQRIERARNWQPPAPNGPRADHSYRCNIKGDVWNAAVAWQLSGDIEIAEKVATFLRGFADPENGYPVTKKGCHQAMVQEGAFFRALSRSYDAIRDTDVLSPEDEARIEDAFRVYLDVAKRRQKNHVGNQPQSTLVGALYSALAIQDWERAEYFLEGPCGLYWHIRRGIMDDGWWCEMSTHYNLGVASVFTKAGLALRTWGVEVLNDKFPAVYHEGTRSYAKPGEAVDARFPKSGIYAAVWGPSYRSYRQVRDLWDATLPLINEDGKMPGLNDSPPEVNVSGRLNVAAYAYGDPKYIRHATGGDLLYPVDRSQLKSPAENKLLPSSVADNAGVAMLRSQGVGSPRQQYQAVLSYGSHGGFHGHWDRVSMTYLRRFGKLLTHTPSHWYGYGTMMYQMGLYQCSMAHSMVIVDGKNQYPAPSDRLLYHNGDLFQAAAVENETRWSNPRFGGHNPEKHLDEEQGVLESKYGGTITIPDDQPELGKMSDFTELVRSRRLMAVTDEYVLIIDNVKGEKEHTFDVIFQFPNFKEFDTRDNIEMVAQREKFDDSPLRTGQFITNARIFEAEGPVRARFLPGYKTGDAVPRPYVKEGMESLNLDVYTVWPLQRKQIVAKNPDHRKYEGEGWNTYSAARVSGREASFVTLLEVQEDESVRQVSEVTADGPDQVQVKLNDGRIHNWQVKGLDDREARPEVELQLVEEGPDGVEERKESTR